MTKQKVGLVLFWIAVIWAILQGVIGSIFVKSAFRNLTMHEIALWGFGGVPPGALVAGIGLLLYSGAKGSTVWKYGIGMVLAVVFAGLAVGPLSHIPPLFGIGGTLILLLFIGILWLWAKERMILKDASVTAAEFKLVGYVFMLIAAWFMCWITSQPLMKALEGKAPNSPIGAMILLVLGWLFLFLGHYKSRKQ